MSIISELGRKIASTGNTVADSAKKLADAAKTSEVIKERQNQIEQLYTKIGYQYYEKMKDAEGDIFLGDLVERVKGLTEDLNKLNVELQVLRGSVSCDACGQNISAGSTFCPECGVAVTAKVEVARNKFCISCGSGMDVNAKFCLSCGYKVEE